MGFSIHFTEEPDHPAPPPALAERIAMGFSIHFTEDPEEHLDDDPSIASAVGEIVLGHWHEDFVASLAEWDKEDYISQWTQSLRQFVDGRDRAVLITQYLSPQVSANLEWWALYRGEGDTVYVQNHLRFYEQLDPEFSASDASNFLKDRQTVGVHGDAISEWKVTLRDVEFFFYRFKHRPDASISTHILDTALGRPASQIKVTLEVFRDGTWAVLHSTVSDDDGRCRPLLPENTPLTAATYRIHFDTAAYYTAQQLTGLYPLVEIVFTVANPDQHYHIPLLLTANGYTTYRGS